ncbi:hypothetical protein WICPIJ_004546 [Wickerhamomyces pijperi]|uniref:Uncharacterized protein n=1 Tax=Wickerhamomyces pijperi TaxID=599730 RepID=A0A9P8TMN3_WICPI|nr:hypothetical protein WICPIJ_004546 [Wickerhamomyces pijperi]
MFNDQALLVRGKEPYEHSALFAIHHSRTPAKAPEFGSGISRRSMTLKYLVWNGSCYDVCDVDNVGRLVTEEILDEWLAHAVHNTGLCVALKEEGGKQNQAQLFSVELLLDFHDNSGSLVDFKLCKSFNLFSLSGFFSSLDLL